MIREAGPLLDQAKKKNHAKIPAGDESPAPALAETPISATLAHERGNAMRGPHDLGGLEAGPIETQAHDMTFWEKQVDALNTLLAKKGLRRTDENRRYIEMLGHDAYSRLSYYERWTAAMARLLIDKGVLTQDEIDAKVAHIRETLGADAG